MTGASASPAERRRLVRIAWLVHLASWTLLGLVQAWTRVTETAIDHSNPVPVAISRGLLDVHSWGALSLLAIWIGMRFPIRRGRLARDASIHLAVGIVLIWARILGVNALAYALGVGVLAPAAIIFRVLPFGLPMYTAMFGVGHALKYLHDLRQKDVAAAHLKAELSAAQVQVLRMQMQPHFLFNTLNTVVSLIHHDRNAAERVVVDLSEMLRRSLAPAGEPESTLREELAVLAPYLDIEQTRLRDRLRVETRIDPETLDARLPQLTLQPLVENAVRHGIAPRRGTGRISITSARADGKLWVAVEDDGIGSREYAREGGIGLRNLQERLGQLYGERGRLRVAPRAEGGTIAEVIVPFVVDAPAAARLDVGAGALG